MKASLLFILFFPLVSAPAMPQELGTGLIISKEHYQNVPQAPVLMRGDYQQLPLEHSLKLYTPTPLSQGRYSSCAGWAAGYEARTIIEALLNGWDKAETDSNAFSPSFIYNQVRTSHDCMSGSFLDEALEVLTEQGCVKLSDFEYSCSKMVSHNDKVKASGYRIREYRSVGEAFNNNFTQYVKKSIANNHPVVAAFDCPPTFKSSGTVWNPPDSDYRYWGNGHALTVIGYSDTVAGGAFELMNSWGTGWGNGGYAWVRYTDFDFFCQIAFELIGFDRKPADHELAGSLMFKDTDGTPIYTKYNNGVFEVPSEFEPGSLLELKIANREPAYVYAFSYDSENNINQLFPHRSTVSAYLPYKNSNLSLPDENSLLMLDNRAEYAYFCFLYSKEKLDYPDMLKQIKITQGTAAEKINKYLGDKSAAGDDLKLFDGEKISFRLYNSGKPVVPVIVRFKLTI